jgi:hypothetical protein
LVGVAVKVTDVPVQIVVWLAATLTDGVTPVVTVIATGVLVAVGVVKHPALLVIVTVTWSLLLSVVDVKVAPVAPATGVPFTDH